MVRNLIAGEWCATEREFTRYNPADTREEVARSPLSEASDVAAAVEAAVHVSPLWRSTPPDRRAAVIGQALDLLAADAGKLAVEDVLESGKTLTECRGEVQRTLATVRHQLGLLGELGTEAVRREPVGVAAVITPWNFPFSVLLRKVVPALATGNAVVAKPSELTPVTAARIGAAFVAAGLPAGALNLVFGEGGVAGQALVDDDRIGAISFTGSTRVGLGIAAAVGDRDVKVQLEMGGKNPMAVLADASLDAAVQDAISACFTAAGQWCVATSRIIVQRSVYEDFLDRFVRRARHLRVGNGLTEGTQMGPVVSQAQYDKVLQHLGPAATGGADVRCGGSPIVDGEYAHGFYVPPTVLADPDPAADVVRAEVFGPVVVTLAAEDLDHAIALANDTAYGLSASVYTGEAKAAARFCDEVTSGKVTVNLPTNYGDVQVPSSGRKNSGRGEPEGALAGLAFYTHPKAVFTRHTGA